MYRILYSLTLLLITRLCLAAEVGSPAPNCVLPELHNPERSVSLRQPNKLVYVDFWASWCGPCVASFPFTQQLHHDFQQKGLAVFAVNMDEYKPDALEFLAEHPVNFTILHNPDGDCADKFAVRAMPSSFLIDASGKIQYASWGYSAKKAAELRQRITELLP